MIRCYIQKKNKLWDVDLPLLTMALHSMVNRQTGYTPNRLMLGRETIQPIQLVLGTVPCSIGKFDPDSWVAHLAKSLNEVHKFARENLRTTQHRQKKDYDLRLAQNHTGDLVYKIGSSTKIGHRESVKRCNDREIPLWLRRMRHYLFYDTSFVHADESTDEDPLTYPDKTLLYCGGQLLQNIDLVSDVSLNDEFQQLFIDQEDPDDVAPQGLLASSTNDDFLISEVAVVVIV
ncbi:unnamed protein product [Mytilus coruscus]|uniref:Uncharacterized protein n=1 Tax=Mytilus coruscus TaxID=42192 RepID=A0A6J8ETG7_MYTCO|nr:unnamed protein product [Mytilus coruscus]